MPKLAKHQKDAIVADHAKGYLDKEIAERNDVHRNTVGRHLKSLQTVVVDAKPVANDLAMAAAVAASRGAADSEAVALLAAFVVVVPCSACEGRLPVLASMPTLFWSGIPCGYVVRCRCGEICTFPIPGREGPARAAARTIFEKTILARRQRRD